MKEIAPAEPFETGVLPRELEQIKKRRERVFENTFSVINAVGDEAPRIAVARTENGDAQSTARLQKLAECFREAHRVRPFGVALSGGGIRSATFSLGILQGLAEKNLLKYVDYLSTVSGGGYIGSWLHGVIRNRCDGDPEKASKILSPSENPVPDSPDDDPIAFLRKYSNYPAPKPTLFSADLWVMGLIWVRNFLLNQLILVPALSAMILLLLIAGFLHQIPNSLATVDQSSLLGPLVVVGLASMALALAVSIAVPNLLRIVEQTLGTSTSSEIASGLGTIVNRTPTDDRSADRWSLLAVPLVFIWALVIGTSDFDGHHALIIGIIAVVLVVLFAVFQRVGGFVPTYMLLHKDKKRFPKLFAQLHVLWMAPAAAALSTGLIFVTWQLMAASPDDKSPWIQLAFAPPLICLSLFSGTSLLLGLLGADYPDGAREWISRVGSMIILLCAVWIALFVIGVFGPWGFAKLLANYGEVGVAAISAWALTTIGGVLIGKSAAGPTTNGAREKRISGLVVSLAPTVFMIGYLLLLAFATHSSLRAVTSIAQPFTDRKSAEAQAKQASVDNASSRDQNALQSGKSALDTEKGRAESQTGKQSQNGETGLKKFFEPFARFAENYFPVLTFSDAQADWTQIFQPIARIRKLFLDLSLPTKPVSDSSDGGETPVISQAVAPVIVSGWEKVGWLLLLLCSCIGIATLASRRININEFSMHHFYKNRLVRCYLGASNSKKRKPNALTGFDPADDLSLSALVPSHSPIPYLGPYPIITTALNLNAGSELAQQERKATSFVFTPEFCGFSPSYSAEDRHAVTQTRGQFEPHGYRATRGYSCPSGPNLGTAMAISGAAANPSSGSQTSGPMAFLLTVFDARLGWWLGNPRWKETSQDPGPLFALKYLFLELLGQTTGRTKFVNLSDGGHFDNLGLYELVRRRCRYIIICDGEQDGDLTFGSLGGAIRKCRADFGVEIDINPDPIRSVNGFSKAHCVMGTIEYPEIEQGFSAPLCSGTEDLRNGNGSEKARGWILYLKSSLVGDEPTDVIEYRSRYPKFPHESTADQFFSESQFESYRRLGLHIVRDAFEGVPLDLNDDSPSKLLRVFQDLTRKWYAPIPVTAEAASRLADAYTSLMRSLGENSTLEPLIAELLPKTATTGNGSAPVISKDNLVFGIELIQLMQNVYTEFALQHRANRANPRNAGWMQVFRRWAQSDLFYKEIWQRVEQDYHPLFRDFIRDLRECPGDDVPMRP